ncbi:MAG: Methionyl-tRNA synthetase [candidate division WS6 bacterium 34_10]|uniref:methionine--tRNA ligase n=1 Tax=candidate division WS6 bacterium 34_10 TaxID=1641389 RepID=A0A117M0D4_9BACT|nr:MAG: Methionyl-tRNA synthetase [candidate division WS6 bacterium 34_10]
MNENKSPEKIFIGVSWPYASSNIHIGHLAGQNVACDVFARYHRLKGNNVLMVSGSDSHGTPILFKAEKDGTTPEELVEKSHREILETFSKLGLIYETYTTTMTKNHEEVVQNIFLVLKERGYIYEDSSNQYFDPKVKRFLPDRYVRGTCPKCGNENARGDECPECGAFLDVEDLIDPRSTLSDAKPKLKETRHFFLDLKKLEPDLSKWINETSDNWRKWVREYSKGWIREGLKPRAVTRDMKFGIDVPIEGWDGKVIYVWVEAVVGYLSAAIEWAKNLGEPSKWEDFWKDPECKHYYFIAGGNTQFHTLIWPAELMGYSEKYNSDELWEKYKLPGETKREKLNLPYDVPSNKMLLYKGKKMSKGENHMITADEAYEKYGPDLTRFFFIRFAPENHDREFSWDDLIATNNNELVANIGNFINRTLTFTYTKFDKSVPEGKWNPKVKTEIENTFKEVGEYIEEVKLAKSLERVLELGGFANKYFNDQAPWADIKENKEEAKDTLFNSIQLVNALRLLLRPYTPFACKKLNQLLNVEDEYDANDVLIEKGLVEENVNTWVYEEIEAGRGLEKPEILWKKIE